MIRKIGDKFILMSEDGKKKLGEFPTKIEAEEREKEILHMKRKKAMESMMGEREKENIV